MTYLEPALLVFLLIAAAGLRHRGLRGRRWAVLGLVLIFLWSWAPFAWLASGTLEWWYPAGALPPADAQAIVVLSGSLRPRVPGTPDPYVGWDTYRRCKHAAWLYQHWRQLPVFASGGVMDRMIVARLMQSALEAEGVPGPAIATEERSSSTYENAAFTADLLRRRGIQKIALVTDARSMLRADLSFRKAGIAVAPAPCCFYTAESPIGVHALLPTGNPMVVNNEVLHEWAGLLWYKLRGRI